MTTALVVIAVLLAARWCPYVTISSWSWWVYLVRTRNFCGVFRNPSRRRNRRCRWLPWRWGFYILGLEIGDRGR